VAGTKPLKSILQEQIKLHRCLPLPDLMQEYSNWIHRLAELPQSRRPSEYYLAVIQNTSEKVVVPGFQAIQAKLPPDLLLRGVCPVQHT